MGVVWLTGVISTGLAQWGVVVACGAKRILYIACKQKVASNFQEFSVEKQRN